MAGSCVWHNYSWLLQGQSWSSSETMAGAGESFRLARDPGDGRCTEEGIWLVPAITNPGFRKKSGSWESQCMPSSPQLILSTWACLKASGESQTIFPLALLPTVFQEGPRLGGSYNRTPWQ